MDVFLRRVYSLWLHHGRLAIIFSDVVQMVKVAFVTWLTYIVGACFDWGGLAEADDLSQVLECPSWQQLGGFVRLLIVFLVVFSITFMYRALQTWMGLGHVQRFMTQGVGLDSTALCHMPWDVVSEHVLHFLWQSRDVAPLIHSRLRYLFWAESRHGISSSAIYDLVSPDKGCASAGEVHNHAGGDAKDAMSGGVAAPDAYDTRRLVDHDGHLTVQGIGRAQLEMVKRILRKENYLVAMFGGNIVCTTARG